MKWIYAKNKKHYLAMELNYSWAIGRYRKLFCFKQKNYFDAYFRNQDLLRFAINLNQHTAKYDFLA